MSGTLTAGQQIRADVANADETVPFVTQLTSNGSQFSVSGTISPNTNLIIDTSGNTLPSTDLFLGDGFSLIQNLNDTSPIIATGTDSVTTELVYQGEAAGQTFYAGTGTEYAAFTGYGNVFAAPTTSGGTYEVSAGLMNAATDLLTLAAAPSVGGVESGNTVVAGGGNASIAAGLGNNAIFLGSGTANVASEGHDAILGGSGNDTIDGLGAATVFAGTGSTTFFGGGGTGVVVGGTVSGAGAESVYGGSGSVTVYGGSGNEVAFGGSAGNNVLVSGSSGSASLVGGGNNDLLVASGTGTTSLVAGYGNETLFGGNASGTTNYFLGGGSDTVVAGTGSEYIQFGSGFSTVFGSTGQDVYGVVDSIGGSTDLVLGFNASQDFINLQGFDSSVTGSSVLASDVSTSDGNSIISLGSGDVIELYGVTNLSASNFVTGSTSAAFSAPTHTV